MISISKNEIDIRYWILGLYIMCTFIDNHSALFISDYFIPLILFVPISFVTKPIRNIFVVNYKAAAFLFLFIIILIGAFLNSDHVDRGTLLSYLVWFAFMFIAMNDNPNVKTIYMLMRVFVIGSIIMSLMVIVYRQNYYQSIDVGLRYTIKFLNNVAIDPNYLAVYLFMGLSISFYFCFFTTSAVFNKNYYSIASIIIFIALAMLGSRAGYVAVIITFIGCIVQLYKIGRGNKKLLAIISILVFLLLGVTLLPMLLPQNILNRFLFASLFDYSNSLRVSHWVASFECIGIKPILGYGPMHSLEILQVYASHRGVAHNTFLTFFLHFGIPGALVIMWILASIFGKLRNGKNIYWIAFFIGFIFINCIVENHLGITFWLPILLFEFITNNMKSLNGFDV